MPSDRNTDDPLRIKDLLPDAGRRAGVKAPLETAVIWARWHDIVGESVAQHAAPSSLKNGTLRVLVDAPAWATEIDYLGSEIAERANRIAGAEVVRAVKAWTSPEAAGRLSGRRDGGQSRSALVDRGAVERPHPEDPAEALDRAREAWLKRVKRGSQVGSGRAPRATPENPEKGR